MVPDEPSRSPAAGPLPPNHSARQSRPARAAAWPTASTRLAGVIGDPVRQSLSPVLHNAAFAALELDWAYVAFPVAGGQVPAALEGMRALGVEGLSVTMPHKPAVAAAVDRLSGAATRLGAVNTVVLLGGDLVGESTDGEGFVRMLRLDEAWDPAGRRCVVLGAGGAARAVVLALAQAGAARVAVVGRRAEMAAAAASLAGAAGVAGSAEMIGDADLVVNATPVGMTGVVDLGRRRPPGSEDDLIHGPPPALPFDLPVGRLGPGQLVADLVYAPAVTPLLREARARGARAVNGLGMLIHQAALQFRLWTGEDPSLEAMSAAALAHLARQGAPGPDHDPLA